MPSTISLSQFLNVDVDDHQDTPSPVWPSSSSHSIVKVEDSVDEPNWSAQLVPAAPSSSSSRHPSASSLDYDEDEDDDEDQSPALNCIPGGLALISMADNSRSPSPEMSLPGSFFTSQQQNNRSSTAATLSTLNPASLHAHAASPSVLNSPANPASKPKKPLALGQPHPYSISPSNTTALFTRASSVSSDPASNAAALKKSRAPPSGPISTKDFIPPDVSGLSKREARLVKNRAAAFLSRQRKREEFEGLETRVEVLEEDNARLYKELEAYRSGEAQPAHVEATPTSSSSSSVLAAELAGLKRQLASRDAELSKLHTRIRSLVAAQDQLVEERARVADQEREISELRSQLGGAANMKRDEDADDSDSEDARSTAAESSKKDLKGPGSMAFMALLFSLSTLMTTASGDAATTAKPPMESARLRRPGMGHHRDSSRSDVLAYSFPDVYSSYDALSAPSKADSMIFPGFEEDSLLGGGPSMFSPNLASGGLSDASAFASLAGVSSPSSTKPADSLHRAISGVKSIGPNEFEFDFSLPSSSSSAQEKKVKVIFKSALPLDMDIGAIASSSKAPTATFRKTHDRFGSTNTLPNPFEFRPDDDLDMATTFPAWSDVEPIVVSSASSPGASSSTSSESKKRKRMMAEVDMLPLSRRRLSDEGDRWDVDGDDLAMMHDLGFTAADEDIVMRN